MTFVTMRQFGVDANIVSLSGIAIAIGVMVDVGIVFTENIIRHLEMPENEGLRGHGFARGDLRSHYGSGHRDHDRTRDHDRQLLAGFRDAGRRGKTL